MKTRALNLNQSGQMVTEMILLIVILLGVSFGVARYFKSNEVLRTLVSGPWESLAGMLQNGNWGSPKRTNVIHPNAHGRHITLRGESAR